jgi:hypothetical protein
MIVQAGIHDRLGMSTTASMGRRSDWEKVLDLQQAYNPVLERIQFLAEKGLTSLMVMRDFLSKRITPLQERARTAWLYTRENDATRLEPSHGMDLETGVLETMLLKLSTDPSSIDFVTPPVHYMPICTD